MRVVIASLAVAASVSSAAVAFQSNAAGVRACSILTKELVAPFAQNKQVLNFPPEEESLSRSGSACEWGLVRLQLYPTPNGVKNRTAPKDFQPLPGVGEAAYFRSNRNEYAELIVWVAKYEFTLQVSVPTGRTAEAIKPDTITLANAVIAKLR